jgi:hypothetical protein
MKKPSRKKSRKQPEPLRRVVSFPEVKGMVIEAVEFSTDSDDHHVTIKFKDRKALHFDFRLEPRFIVDVDYAQWTNGNWHPIKVWPTIPSN